MEGNTMSGRKKGEPNKENLELLKQYLEKEKKTPEPKKK
jgi:hypothetical protein